MEGEKTEKRKLVVLPSSVKEKRQVVNKLREAGECVVGIGGSMEPCLVCGDKVLVKEVRRKIKAGRIVVFVWNGNVRIHRVVRVKGSVFWARGDSGVKTEGPLTSEDLIGVAEGYWRDGRYTSLIGGRWQEIEGLVWNVAMCRLRNAARRLPGLRRRIDVYLHSYRLGRSLLAPVCRSWYGDVELVVEDSIERVVGAMVSESNPLTQKLVDDVEERVARGEIRLLVARSERKGRIGRLLLVMVTTGADVRVGYLNGFYVSFGARVMGVGSKLLRFAEDEVEKRGLKRLAALVNRDNIWNLRAFESAGFRVVCGDELETRPEAERASVPAHQVLVEKELR